MKKVAVWLLAALFASAAVDALGDLTQSRPDAHVPGSETVLRYTVASQRYRRGDDAAAEALWAVCMATARGDVMAGPHRKGDVYEVTITPALGKNARKRLVGCLEDATLDRVLADVVAVEST